MIDLITRAIVGVALAGFYFAVIMALSITIGKTAGYLFHRNKK